VLVKHHDAIAFLIGHKNPHEIWNRFQESHPEVLTKCENFQFPGKVRFTPDGRISVYDAIAYSTGHKNPRDVWDELSKRLPEVVGFSDNFQFPGQELGQIPWVFEFTRSLQIVCNIVCKQVVFYTLPCRFW
jgi:hypothetical protein